MVVPALQTMINHGKERGRSYRPLFKNLDSVIFFKKYLRNFKGSLFSLFVITCFIVVLNIVDPLFIKYLIDSAIPNEDFKAIILVAIIFISFIVIRSVIFYAQSIIYSKVNAQILFNIRYDFIKHFQRISIKFIDSINLGEFTTRVESDISMIQYFATDLLVGLVTDISMTAIIAIIIFYFNLELGLLTLCILPIYYIIIKRYNNKLKANAIAFRSSLDKLVQQAQQTFLGINIIRAYTYEKQNLINLQKLGERHIPIQVNKDMTTKIFSLLLNMFTNVIPTAVIFYGAILVINNTITIGVLMAYYAYLLKLLQPFHRIARSQSALQEVYVSAERLLTYLNQPAHLKDSGLDVSDIYKSILFSHVSFAYGSEYIIKDVNLAFNKNQKIALVGKSGSGKSTILKLILRFYDINSGIISLDGKNISEYKPIDFRKLFAYVGQNEFMFNITGIENIRIANPKIENETILHHAKNLGVRHILVDENHDEIIYRDVSDLSGGEQQIIGILRAIVSNSPVLILDEATSNLDSVIEEKIMNYLVEDIFNHKTIIVAAHRLHSIKNFDKIVLFKNGQIIQEGSHFELLNSSRDYKYLWDTLNKI